MDLRLTAPTLEFFVDVRLTNRAGRWVAVARVAGEREIGLARTAHEALRASLCSLGSATVALLLADPGLMAASAEMR